MRLKNLALSVLVCVGAVACRSSFADTLSTDTLSLVSTGGQAVGGVYVYPYNLSFNGSATTSPMMCINYNDEITQGETWHVTEQQISTASSTQIKEDAWLFSQVGAGTYSLADLQFAVWDILDPGTGGNAGLDATALNLVDMAASAAPTLGNSFLNHYTILSPDLNNQAGWTAGTPQSFIAESTAVTPEPSSLLLLGTGLCAASVVLMRRRAIQEQQSGNF